MMCGLTFLHWLQKKNHHVPSQDLLHLISSPLCSVAVPCAFTQASSHRCHEGFSSHDLHREQGMLERITCVDLSRKDSKVDMFERQGQARMVMYHIMNTYVKACKCISSRGGRRLMFYSYTTWSLLRARPHREDTSLDRVLNSQLQG